MKKTNKKKVVKKSKLLFTKPSNIGVRDNILVKPFWIDFLLDIKNFNVKKEGCYTHNIYKHTGKTYSYLSKLRKILELRGYIISTRRGRMNYLSLTDKGGIIVKAFEVMPNDDFGRIREIKKDTPQ